MDIFLLVTGFIFTLIGVVGAFLPVLPGPFMGWIGLLLLHLTSVIPISYPFLIITFLIAVVVWMLDYIIPSIGTKRFGGSKWGAIGTTIGLIVGLIMPIPLGFIIGAFLGAFIGEMFYNSKDIERAVKAAFGSFLGFLASTSLKLIVSLIFVGLYIYKTKNYWEHF
ncbi:MAG: DUF456 domain-containing protein [Flavobacteriaceae bacterium]|nr:DUF456 domain-containing protein [Flavobacteriaceae bacterium]